MVDPLELSRGLQHLNLIQHNVFAGLGQSLTIANEHLVFIRKDAGNVHNGYHDYYGGGESEHDEWICVLN